MWSLPAARQSWEIFGESLIVATRQFTRKVSQHVAALLDISLFSDKHWENGHCLYIFRERFLKRKERKKLTNVSLRTYM